MEDLTKQQLVLVALLVSFVTSIATGIMTVSILDEAPQTVTQTISRVVEKTIETVTSANTKASVTREIKEVKTVVDAEEALAAAIEKSVPSIVRVRGRGDAGSTVFLSIGVVLDDKGIVVTDKSGVTDGVKYEVVFSDGTILAASIISRNDAYSVAFLQVEKSEDSKFEFVAAKFNSEGVKLGQSIVALGGEERNRLLRGIVTGLIESSDALAYIESDIALPESFLGAPLVDLAGKVVGLRTRNAEVSGRNAFLAAALIKAAEMGTSSLPGI